MEESSRGVGLGAQYHGQHPQSVRDLVSSDMPKSSVLRLASRTSWGVLRPISWLAAAQAAITPSLPTGHSSHPPGLLGATLALSKTTTEEQGSPHNSL